MEAKINSRASTPGQFLRAKEEIEYGSVPSTEGPSRRFDGPTEALKSSTPTAVMNERQDSLVLHELSKTPQPVSHESNHPYNDGNAQAEAASYSSLRCSSSLAIPSSRAVVYHRKDRRKQHPLQESLSTVDVWPAPRHVRPTEAFANTTAAMPQLLTDVLDEVTRKLHRLASKYPSCVGLHDNSVPVFDESGFVTNQSSSKKRNSPRKGEPSQQRQQQQQPHHASSPLSDVSVILPPLHIGPATPSSPTSPLPLLKSPTRAQDDIFKAMGGTPMDDMRGLGGRSPMYLVTIDGKSPQPHRGGGLSTTARQQQQQFQQQQDNSKIVHKPVRTSEQVRNEARSLVAHTKGGLLSSSTPAKSKIAAIHHHQPPSTLVTAPAVSRTGAAPEEPQKRSQLTIQRSEEDLYRGERISIFESAALDIANQFSTYKIIFWWIFKEFREYEAYCHKHVVSPEMRAKFEEDLRHELLEEFAHERARLTFDITSLKQSLAELDAKYQASRLVSQSCDRKLAEKDAQIEAKDKEIADNAEGRAALLSRITRLEKELWAQRDVLEGPEAIINALKREVKSLEERLAFSGKALEESNMDKAVLKVRLERLEELLKDRKMRQAQTVPKSELILYKKAQMDVLELNATLETKLLKLRSAYRNSLDEMQRMKAGQPLTPRPPWHMADDVFPPASTTAQRVHLAMREYRTMIGSNQTLTKENEELKRIIAMHPRGEDNANCEYILPEMQLKYFYKLGFDGSVPSFLRGNGKAANLKLSFDQTAGFCRLLFLHRDSQRSSTSPEGVFESFCVKYTPPNHTGQDLAYSLHHSIRWFAFDPFIGLMRRYISDDVDDTTMTHLEKIIVGCRLFILNAADELNLGKESAASSKEAGANAAAAVEGGTEIIRRKSMLGMTTVADAEAQAKKALSTNTFSSIALNSEEPRQLYKTEILPLITEYFCQKTEEDIKGLVSQLNMDYPGIHVDVKGLFRFNGVKRRFTSFVEEIIRQELRTQATLLIDYTLAIQTAIDSDGHATPKDVSKALWRLDPLIPAAYMDDLMSDLFEVSVEDLRPKLIEGRYYRTPGLEGERCYEENSEDPIVADEVQVISHLKRRVLQCFCPKEEADIERQRLEKEAERAKERAELDF